MKRFGYAGLLFLLACVWAGIFGMLHNQISYTVSPEYFTQFKFQQFEISEIYTGRAGAAIVGFLATWWMGFLISVFVVPVAMVFREPKQFFAQTLKAFGVVALTALLTGLIALIVSNFTIDENSAAYHHRIVGSIAKNVAFLRAGMMHNFSYLGGIFGIITAITYLLLTRYVLKINKLNETIGNKFVEVKNKITDVVKKKKSISIEKYRKLIRILFVLIAIRLLCFAYILYQVVAYSIAVFKQDKTFYDEIRIVISLFVLGYLLIMILDILTLWKIKKDKISFKITGLISSIISIIPCINFVIYIIREIMFYYSHGVKPGATWITYYYYYVFHVSDLTILLVLAISIYCVIVLFKNKFNRVHETPKFAEPVMEVDQFPQDLLTEPQAEDEI